MSESLQVLRAFFMDNSLQISVSANIKICLHCVTMNWVLLC